jgi:plasmid stabilization system protein ParE
MQILYVPEIVGDMADARDWYESRSDGLGEEFVRMTYAAFEELVEFPEKHEVVYGSHRRALLRRFPYSVYYVIGQDTITVYGVFHTSRDPHVVTEALDNR